MNKEIEELAMVIGNATNDAYSKITEQTLAFVKKNHKYSSKNDFEKAHPKTAAELTAEALYNAGYRKTVWHKVADGDLPVFGNTVIAYDGFYTFAAYKNYENEWYYVAYDTPACGIIAWAELPEYEGEE